MRARVVTKVIIHADAESVFRYLSDLQYHKLWNPHLQRIEPMMVLQPGSTYRSTSFLFGRRISGENKVVKLVTPRELRLNNTTGMLHYDVSYELTDQGAGTLLTCRTVVSTQSKAFAFAKPMMQLLARHELQSDLDALKVAVEQGLK